MRGGNALMELRMLQSDVTATKPAATTGHTSTTGVREE